MILYWESYKNSRIFYYIFPWGTWQSERMNDSCRTFASASRQRRQQSQTMNTNRTGAQEILTPNLRMQSTGSNLLLLSVPLKYIHIILFFIFKETRLWFRAFPCVTKPKPTSYKCLQFDTVQRTCALILWRESLLPLSCSSGCISFSFLFVCF